MAGGPTCDTLADKGPAADEVSLGGTTLVLGFWEQEQEEVLSSPEKGVDTVQYYIVCFLTFLRICCFFV